MNDTTTCDRCGAPGQTRFVLMSGLDLVFCGHHTRALADDLTAAGALVDLVPVNPTPLVNA